MQTVKMNKKQRGMTMIETMIVIIIAVIIIAGAIFLYSKNEMSTKSLGTQQQVLVVASAVRELSPGPVYTGISGSVVASTKKVPTDMISGTTLVNKFNGTITVAAATYPTGAAADSAFTMAFPAVPTAVCSDIVAKGLSQFPKIAVGATVVQDKLAATPVVATAATIAAGCSSADPVTVTFTAT